MRSDGSDLPTPPPRLTGSCHPRCDVGFGDAGALIAIMLETGCSGIGVEINGDLCAEARTHGASEGLVALAMGGTVILADNGSNDSKITV